MFNFLTLKCNIYKKLIEFKNLKNYNFWPQPLEKRNFYRYGFDIFVRENWEVIYCNLVYSNFENDNLENEKKMCLEYFKNIKVYNIKIK